ncbi:MAG TPA: 3-deoxy-7-phosphoheptulonate synthase [Gammaproteobacteria bacterium]|nr:3-deoxy-7-phosphoheptulonate synthase [Gammaproteobacteria bacterium]
MLSGNENINIRCTKPLLSPDKIKKILPSSFSVDDFISQSRLTVRNILAGKDPRLLVIVGPCSIHDTEAALEYAEKLKSLAEEVASSMFIVMRVYFEKPRTVFGWKGLINDPHLNDTFEIEEGLLLSRRLLIVLAEMGVPAATESLDPISPQYIQDLITWTAIGARTTESQTHREMASGLSSPVGFKNSTDGSLDTAINAIKSSARPHSFLGVDDSGVVSIVNTTGKSDTHIVLRGCNCKPNYAAHHVKKCEQQLLMDNIKPSIMIDCSHENSGKDHSRQPYVVQDIVKQILAGNKSIRAVMLESFLYEGNQKLDTDKSKLKYGISITDKCLSWTVTVQCIMNMHRQLEHRLAERVMELATKRQDSECV